MHIIFVLTFIFEMLIFVYCKKKYVLEFNNCICKFDKNKNKNLNKKKFKKYCIDFSSRLIDYNHNSLFINTVKYGWLPHEYNHAQW